MLGVGGRLVMLASRLLHPDAVGRITENGNRIGEFTVDGTVALIIFGGLGSGVLAGVVWVLVKEWIPDRAVWVGLGAVGIGGFALVEADNQDFVILVNPQVDVLLLLALLLVFGVTTHIFDRSLDRRILRGNSTASIVVSSLIVAAGISFSIPTFGSFLSTEFCFCESPPIWTGIFLLGAGGASLLWWVLELRGASSPPRAVQIAGRVALLGAVLAGAAHLSGQILEVL